MRIFSLAMNNLRRRRGQSLLTVIITAVTIFIFTLVLGTILIMNQGLELSKSRLGADAVLVPRFSGIQSEELLFTANPENTYMSADILEEAKQLEGISTISPQFFAQTLALDCCSPGEEIRIIGYDSKTDFVVLPHLEEDVTPSSEEDLVLGSNFFSDIVGENYLVLGHKFFSKGQLVPTGTGMDNTIFMEMDTVRKLCLESDVLKQDWTESDPFDSISVIMVQLEEGYDREQFEENVKAAGLDVDTIFTGDTIASMQNQFAVIMKVMLVLWIASLIITILSLFGRFDSLARDRKKEIGLLRALGVTSPQTFSLILLECCTLALIGGIIGSIIAVLSMGPVLGALKDAFRLSPSVWSWGYAILCGIAGIILALLIGFISSIYPALKSAAMDPQEAITQGEK